MSGPVSYRVQTSMDGTTWSAPVAQGNGAVPTTIISVKPVRTKFIRVTETASAKDGEYWSIQQVRVYRGSAAVAGS